MKQARLQREKEAVAASGQEEAPFWLAGPSERPGNRQPQQDDYGMPPMRPGSRGKIRMMPQIGDALSPAHHQQGRQPPSSDAGMFRGQSDEQAEKRKRAQAQQAYMRELEEQMRARDERKAQEKAAEEAFNRRFEAEAQQFNALGQRKEREGAELEQARKVTGAGKSESKGGAAKLTPAEAAAQRREQYAEEFAALGQLQNQGHARQPAQQQDHKKYPGGIGTSYEDPGVAAMRALGVPNPGGSSGQPMPIGGNFVAHLMHPPTRITQPLEDPPLMMIGGSDGGGTLARRAQSARIHGPVIRGLDSEAHLGRLLDWERERAREREVERERDKEREREREERIRVIHQEAQQRQRVWDQRLREEETERHAKAERLMQEEIATLRRDLLEQHRRLASQVEEQINRLKQSESKYRAYSQMSLAPTPPSGAVSLPPTGSGVSGAGYGLMMPATAGRGGSVSETPAYAGSAPHPAYVVPPPMGMPMPAPPPGSEAYEAAAREALRELTAGGVLPPTVPTPGVQPQPPLQQPYGFDSAADGDELDKLLLNFLANGADLRGS